MGYRKGAPIEPETDEHPVVNVVYRGSPEHGWREAARWTATLIGLPPDPRDFLAGDPVPWHFPLWSPSPARPYDHARD